MNGEERRMKTEKRVSDSRTTQVQIIMERDINGASRLFGGQLLEWIDVVAAVVARRHCQQEVTTAAIDNLQFRAPAQLGSTLCLVGQLTHVGRTSMEVRVDSFTRSCPGTAPLSTGPTWCWWRLIRRAAPLPFPV